MTTSLKAFLPTVARIFNVSPDTLYERQRSLVREGLLTLVPGRGPGSGIAASPESVAVLIIGLLASVSLTEAGRHARRVTRAKALNRTCPLTGMATFADAVARFLSDKTLSERVTKISAQGSYGSAQIEFRTEGKTDTSSFIGRLSENAGLYVTVSLEGHAIQRLAKSLGDLE